MKAKLIVVRAGEPTDIEYGFGDRAVIGRFDPSIGPIDVDLGGIEEGGYVSRKHAEIILVDGEWKLRDLGSSNGTFVLEGDFQRVEEATIVSGTQIALGNARLVFEEVSEETQEEEEEEEASEPEESGSDADNELAEDPAV